MKRLLISGAGLVAVGGLLWLAYQSGGPETPPVSPSPAALPDTSGRAVPPSAPAAPPPPAAVADAAGPVPGSPPLPADAPAEAILAEIEAASISYDARELPRIRPFLTHPDPAVREAAVNGVFILGDAAGAPLLREAARLTATPQEAVRLLEMADYLELPSGSLISRKKDGTRPSIVKKMPESRKKGGPAPGPGAPGTEK